MGLKSFLDKYRGDGNNHLTRSSDGKILNPKEKELLDKINFCKGLITETSIILNKYTNSFDILKSINAPGVPNVSADTLDRYTRFTSECNKAVNHCSDYIEQSISSDQTDYTKFQEYTSFLQKAIDRLNTIKTEVSTAFTEKQAIRQKEISEKQAAKQRELDELRYIFGGDTPHTSSQPVNAKTQAPKVEQPKYSTDNNNIDVACYSTNLTPEQIKAGYAETYKYAAESASILGDETYPSKTNSSKTDYAKTRAKNIKLTSKKRNTAPSHLGGPTTSAVPNAYNSDLDPDR